MNTLEDRVRRPCGRPRRTSPATDVPPLRLPDGRGAAGWRAAGGAGRPGSPRWRRPPRWPPCWPPPSPSPAARPGPGRTGPGRTRYWPGSRRYYVVLAGTGPKPWLAAAGRGPRHPNRPDRGHARRAPAGRRVHHGGCRLRRGPLRAGRRADDARARKVIGPDGRTVPGKTVSSGADRPDPLLPAADQLIRPGLGAEPAACPGAAGRCELSTAWRSPRMAASSRWPSAAGGPRPGPEIQVDTLATGAQRVWTWPGAQPIEESLGGTGSALSWAADDRTLAFRAADRRPVQSPAAGHHRAGQQPGGQAWP